MHTTHRAADGSELAVRMSVSRMDDGYVVLCANHTALRRIEQTCQTVVASLQEGVVVIGADGTVESVNPATLRIFGGSTAGVGAVEFAKAAEVPVYDANGRLLTWDQRPVMEILKRSPRRGCIYGLDRFSDGERIWVSINWSLLDPSDPDRSSVLMSIVDITDQHNAHRQLAYQATHDLLTGLPNRAHLVALINDAIGSAEYRWGAVLFIDLTSSKPSTTSWVTMRATRSWKSPRSDSGRLWARMMSSAESAAMSSWRCWRHRYSASKSTPWSGGCIRRCASRSASPP